MSSSAAVAAKLDQRYGRTRSPRRRRLSLIAGVLAAALALAWLVWAGLGGNGASVTSTDVGFRIVGDSAVDFTFDVAKDPARTASCTLQALDRTNGTVGLVTVTVGPSREQVTRTTRTIRTSAAAVNAVVRSCTLRP